MAVAPDSNAIDLCQDLDQQLNLMSVVLRCIMSLAKET